MSRSVPNDRYSNIHGIRALNSCGARQTNARWHTDRTPEVDPLAEDQVALKTSRQRILATADRVVPSHGEPFEAGRSS